VFRGRTEPDPRVGKTIDDKFGRGGCHITMVLNYHNTICCWLAGCRARYRCTCAECLTTSVRSVSPRTVYCYIIIIIIIAGGGGRILLPICIQLRVISTVATCWPVLIVLCVSRASHNTIVILYYYYRYLHSV